jgi:hypothetical protein
MELGRFAEVAAGAGEPFGLEESVGAKAVAIVIGSVA